MKKYLMLILWLVLELTLNFAYAGWVNGYYRKNGTYVHGHYRSNPNSTKADNYGPSRSTYELYTPSVRDYDNDGVANMYDSDDDNDGFLDDSDARQYNPFAH